MNILNICNNPDVLKSMRIVRTVILIIRIAVPIILILSIMITYLQAVKNDDAGALNKANKNMVPKLIAAVLVFFIPTFVNTIAGVLDVNKNSYISCIKLATKGNINKAYYDMALEKVNRANETVKETDYQAAVNAINKIDDESSKNKLLNMMSETLYYINLRKDILSLKNNYDRAKYMEVYDKVQKITREDIKKELDELLKTVGLGRPLDVEPGITELLHYGSSNNGMSYYVVVPPHPTTNMALVVFLHGDGGLKKPDYVASGKAYYGEEYFYLAPSPNNFRKYYSWSINGNEQTLVELINKIVNQYEIDKDRIIIQGFSRGAIGVWSMVNSYPSMFSVAYPISCRPVGGNAKNYKTTIVRAHVGDQCGEKNGYECVYIDPMRNLVNKIKKAGGDATLEIHKGKAHGGCNYVLNEKETIDFMLSVKKKR